jgi:hypothetical protein
MPEARGYESAKTLTGSLTTVTEIPVDGSIGMVIQFTMTGQPLTSFSIGGKLSGFNNGVADLDYSTLASAAAAYTTPVYPVLKASGDLNIAAAGATPHLLQMDVAAYDKIIVRAAGNGGIINLRWKTI